MPPDAKAAVSGSGSDDGSTRAGDGSALQPDPPAWAPAAPPVGAIELPVRIRFLECDPQGVLAHPRFLDLFDDAYMRLNATRLGGFDALMRSGLETLVVRTNVEFLRSVRAEDELLITLDLQRLGRSSLTLRYRATGRDDGELRARAQTTYVCALVGQGRSTPIPHWMRERYLALGGPAAE